MVVGNMSTKFDVEEGQSTMVKNGRGVGVSSKENLRVTISDPERPSDRRTRWLNDKIRLGNLKKMSHNKSDSGYNGDSLPQLNINNSIMSSSGGENHVNGPFGKKSSNGQFGYNSEKWSRHPVRGKSETDKSRTLRTTCSLNCSCHEYLDDSYHFLRHRSSTNDNEDNDDIIMEDHDDDHNDHHHYGCILSRQNGRRHSLKHQHDQTTESPTYSEISSESETSQGDLEQSHEGSSMYKIARDKARKQSIFFNNTSGWNDDNLSHRFRDMSPSTGSILEAAWNGDVSVIEEIISADQTLASINANDIFGRTPLILAAACGHAAAVELLLQKGADVQVCDFQHKATPLMCAAGCGSLAVVELLLAHGANVNAGHESGRTALLWAVQAESVECTKKLLESGALPNPPLAYSETAIHVAAALGNLDCLQLLIDHGADVTLIMGDLRRTALHLATEEGSIPCIRQLLKAGASHSAKDARSQTPLHLAAACDTDATAILLAAGADANARDANGRTPLHCSVARGSRAAECVRLLIEAHADVNAQDCFGYSPLHLAAVNESSQCASLLIIQGADVTAKTKAGTSALSVLVRRIPDVVRFLVERLDSAVTVHDHDPGEPDCELRLDFRAIVPNSEKRLSDSKKNSKIPETEFLTCVLATGNKKILAHPLSEAFLHLKWRCVRKYFFCSLFFQIALVLLYTCYVVNVYLIQCPHNNHHEHEDTVITLSDNHEFSTTTPMTPMTMIMIPTPPTPTPENGGREGHFLTTTMMTTTTKNSGGGFHQDEIFPKIPLIEQQQSGGSIREGIFQNKSSILVVDHDGGGPGGGGERVKRSSDNFKFTWFNLNPKYKSTTTGTTTTTTTTPAPAIRSRSSIFFNPIPASNAVVNTVVVNNNNNNNNTSDHFEDGQLCQLDVSLTVVWCFLVSFTLVMAIKEIFQLVQAPLAYVVSSENWGQWALIGSVALTSWPETSETGLHIAYWQYPAAAFGIFLAYSLMLLQVGRQPALGLYVQMLGKVAANFGLFILAYACLLIAFALAFCVIFPGNPAYSSPPLALMKVLTMMVGEVDYEEQFYGTEDNQKQTIPYPITAHVLHSAFVIIVTIVLMNLLVGLAVNDISGLQKGAKLNRLSRQTALICRLESFIFSKRLQACLPRSIGNFLQKNALLVPSSYNWSFYFRPNDPRDKRLPKELKQAALRLAAAKYTTKHITKTYNNDLMTKSTGHGAINASVDACFRKLDQRIDRLQKQIDSALKNVSDNTEKMLLLLEQKQSS